MSEKLTRSEQARINGSKSNGPTSIEGKARSSANAIKHGFAAVINVVLSIEDEPAFQAHVEGFRASFQPQNYVENSLVEQLAAIQWRQSRLVGLETALIDAPVALHNVHICTRSPISSEDEYFHLVKAWQALAREPERPKADDEPRDHNVPQVGYDISGIELVRRYQVSLDRQFRNTLLNLRQYRKDFAPTQAATPNEPEIPPPPAEETVLGNATKAKIKTALECVKLTDPRPLGRGQPAAQRSLKIFDTRILSGDFKQRRTQLTTRQRPVIVAAAGRSFSQPMPHGKAMRQWA